MFRSDPFILFGNKEIHTDENNPELIYFPPDFHKMINTTSGRIAASTAREIAHELGHVLVGLGKNEEMRNVLMNENPVAAQLIPSEPARTTYP